MPHFHFGGELTIDRPLDRVRTFFSDPQSSVLWDRSVSKVIVEPSEAFAAGARFTTIGPFRNGREGKRSEYEVVEVRGDESKIALVNSTAFRSAVWTTRLAGRGATTHVEFEMDMSTDLIHAPLGWLLKMNAGAIATDLQFLKRAIENGEVAKR